MTGEKVFIPLVNDILFKGLITYPDNNDILMDFLKTFTKFSDDIITRESRIIYDIEVEEMDPIEEYLFGDFVIEFHDFLVSISINPIINEFSIIRALDVDVKLFGGKTLDFRHLIKTINICLIEQSEIDFTDYNNSKCLFEQLQERFNKLDSTFQIKLYLLDDQIKESNVTLHELEWLKYLFAKNEEDRKLLGKNNLIFMRSNSWIQEYVLQESTNEDISNWQNLIYEKEISIQNIEKL